jgi:hypothetical protein
MSGSPIGCKREATRGCMGRLRFGPSAWVVVTSSLFLFLPACGKSKPPGPSPFPVKITLNPSVSASMQVGTLLQFTARAQNSANSTLATTFTYSAIPSGILDVAPNGAACAGAWNAPLYSICTPAGTGTVQVTASALGATSPATLVFVHPPIDNIQISVVPPANSQPPACPNQVALPEACNLPFNPNAANFCLSQNQVQTLQATAFSQGTDITLQVGPFTWSEVSPSVVKITPIVTSTSYNVPTNQATASPSAPGQTQVIASASGVFSQPYIFEACPVQCIALQLSANGVLLPGSSFAVNKGTSETIAATAVDVQGCIVPKPPLTWTSSSPAALSAGGTSGCAPGTSCTISTTQPGSAAITASCTPPTCNIGFPLNPAGFPLGSIFIPQPVYPVTAISGLVTGATTSTSVLATSQDCFSDILCLVGIYNVSTSTHLPGGATQSPTPPNSLMFDPAGDKAYMGSEFGALAINPANVGGNSSPFTSLPAPGTTLGLVIGKVLAVSHNGSQAIFSDTVSTPNQVYVVSTSPSSTTPLNINSATAAAFSPDGLKAFILGDGGNTLYVYSTLQYLQTAQPNPLPTPATSIVFNSTGSFALLSGGSPAGSLAIYNTCDNSLVLPYLSAPGILTPPLFLKMVPAGEIPQGNPQGNLFGSILIPNLEPVGLDFFFGLDNTGIDIIATNSASGPLTALCPQQVTLAYTPPPPPTPPNTFSPVHINISKGTFHPINFFLSPDATRAYIVTTDQGVLVYDFNTNSVSGIQLINNAVPVAADITVDGSLIYVAGTDHMLHELNTATAVDQNQTFFSDLPNSSNSFCFTGASCNLNIVAVRP